MADHEMNGAAGPALFEWGYASVPFPGEPASGDMHLVVDRPRGPLIAVMDGLGHGPSALEAAKTAADVIGQHSDASISELIAICHRALRVSRGIAMTLTEIDLHRATVTWAGIGNVEGKLLRSSPGGNRQHESILLRGGVVGYQIPSVQPRHLDIYPGDVLIFATDGVSPRFGDGVILSDPPQWIAERIMNQHNRHKDDALVVVGRYVGPDHE